MADGRVDFSSPGVQQAALGALGFVVGVLGYVRELERSGGRWRWMAAVARSVAGAVVSMVTWGALTSAGVNGWVAAACCGIASTQGLVLLDIASSWLLSRVEVILNSAAAKVGIGGDDKKP